MCCLRARAPLKQWPARRRRPGASILADWEAALDLLSRRCDTFLLIALRRHYAERRAH